MYDKNGFDQLLWNGMGVLSLTVLEPLVSLQVAALGEPSPTVTAFKNFLFSVNSKVIHHAWLSRKSDVTSLANQNLVEFLCFLWKFFVYPVKILHIVLLHHHPQLLLKLFRLLGLLGDLFCPPNFNCFWSHWFSANLWNDFFGFLLKSGILIPVNSKNWSYCRLVEWYLVTLRLRGCLFVLWYKNFDLVILKVWNLSVWNSKCPKNELYLSVFVFFWDLCHKLFLALI